jgi:hypothetical protein
MDFAQQAENESLQFCGFSVIIRADRQIAACEFHGGFIMRKGFIILGECILLIVVLLMIKIFVGKNFPAMADNNVTSFVFYCISGMGSVLIYRLNTKNKG